MKVFYFFIFGIIQGLSFKLIVMIFVFQLYEEGIDQWVVKIVMIFRVFMICVFIFFDFFCFMKEFYFVVFSNEVVLVVGNMII